MDAIGTVTNLATYTLTILGIVIALIALFGFTAMYRKVQLIAKQIANKRFNDYIETDEFKGLLKVAVEQAFLERTALRLQEEVRDPADQPAFPSGDAA